MKNLLRSVITVLCQLMFTHVVCAQGTATSSNEVPKIEAGFATKPSISAAPVGKAVTITIKNTAEKPVAIFAGPKEEIRDPKVQTLGGISYNKLYLKENEVVCLVTDDKRPIACTVIKPGVTSVEVNASGTNLATK